MTMITEEDSYYAKLLHEVQANGFALLDIQLYLDTHPDDVAALQDYLSYAQRHRLLKRAFEERYGPLTSTGDAIHTSGFEQWVYAPWPWEV